MVTNFSFQKNGLSAIVILKKGIPSSMNSIKKAAKNAIAKYQAQKPQR